MKLYIDDNTNADEIFNTSSLTPEGRRLFMIYSTCFLGAVMLPNKSEALLPALVGRIFIQSFWRWWVRSGVKKGIRVVKRGPKRKPKPEDKSNLGIEIAKESLRSGVEIIKASHRIKEEVSLATALPIRAKGIELVLNNLAQTNGGNNFKVWDQTGKAISPKDGSLYNNKIYIKITNKANKYTERKIQLILVDRYGRKEHKKQFTVKSDRIESSIFNVSDAFTNLPATGIKEIVYKVVGNYRDIEVSSLNPNILVSRLIDV